MGVDPNVLFVDGREEDLLDHTEESWNVVKAKFFAENKPRIVKDGRKVFQNDAMGV